MRKLLATASAAAILFLCIMPSAFGAWPASVLRDSGVRMDSGIYLLANAEDGELLISRSVNKRTAPASLTKIATAAVILEECKDLTETVTVLQSDLDALYQTNSSASGLRRGEVRTIRELLACLLLASGNDAAVVLARHVGNITERMNAFAQSAGCTNTQFKNPHGLDEDGHYSSAHDILRMTMKAMEYPVFEELVAMTEYTLPERAGFPQRKLQNINRLMNRFVPDYYSPYARGVKTGFTTAAGNCLVSYAQHNGYRYYTVVLQGKRQKHDTKSYEIITSFTDTRKLLAWAFDSLRLARVVTPADVLHEVPLLYSATGDAMSLGSSGDVYMLIPRGIDPRGLLIRADESTMPEELEAPLKQGDSVGRANIYYANNEIGSLELVAMEDAQRSAFKYAVNKVSNLVRQVVFRLVLAVLAVLAAGFVVLRIYQNKKKKSGPQKVQFRL
ncbi:MAG: D-alanyl-D-alanine carboxypeptidase [Oscillospiraceae bacterium]|nr:D-alanyl-D-alanine carboxypeptidase [Oscillospiraceae bacterium]